ncbi:uncharacterized protein UTRI_00348_B [Ustilago trichophora]|uniref:RING-type domain-containing protein n=1 Tax=Ustilago trichophora TaxID=86804 RepID=A0A5C3DRY3_9BASI|nr:uncharacterized protein UTRI_00348_B [Ustilago trichophora]
MGQQQTKEAGASGASAQHSSHTRTSSRGMTPSTSANLVASLSAASLSPPSPPPLPTHLADTVKVDEGGLVPNGVYTGPQDYDQHFVRQNIVDRRLAPFCKGSDDEDDYAESKFNSECPICFLYYPSPLNFSRCCHQPICTECFVQMKRADPTSTNPPSSEPRSCPFCVEPNFGVTYSPPEALTHGRRSSGSGSGSDSPNDATDAANFAEMAIGTGGAGLSGAGKKKILAADDPSVITVDQVRPDWHYKLAQAEAAVARRANRRVIMRQVGDRLIPIGISSSRMGADLAAAAESGRINLNGPGGSIILNDGQNWPGSTGTVSTSRRRSSRPSRSANDGLPELARMMRNAAGEDMEEAMVMEAMRLSLLEHEEQQRKQAEEEKKKKKAAAATAAAASTTTAQESSSSSNAATAVAAASGSSRDSTSNDVPAGGNTATRSPPPAAQSVLEESEARSPSGAPLSPPRLPVTMVDPASFGLSQTTMDELRELIDGGPSPPASSASASSPNGASSSTPTESSGAARPHRSIPAPAPVPVPQPVAGLGSVLSERHDANISSQHGYPSPPPETGAGVTKHATTYSTTTASFDANTSAPGSPSSSGFSAPRSRIINPNNPFRRSLGEHH